MTEPTPSAVPSQLEAPKGLEHVRRPNEVRQLEGGRLGLVYLTLTGRKKRVPDPDRPGETKELRGVRQTMTEVNLDRVARKRARRELGISGKKLRKLLKAEKRRQKAEGPPPRPVPPHTPGRPVLP